MELPSASTYSQLAKIYTLPEGKEKQQTVHSLPKSVQDRINRFDSTKPLNERIQIITNECLMRYQSTMLQVQEIGKNTLNALERLELESALQTWVNEDPQNLERREMAAFLIKSVVSFGMIELNLSNFPFSSLPNIFHLKAFQNLTKITLPKRIPLESVLQTLSSLPKTCTIDLTNQVLSSTQLKKLQAHLKNPDYSGPKVTLPNSPIEQVFAFSGESLRALPQLESHKDQLDTWLFPLLETIHATSNPTTQKELAQTIVSCLQRAETDPIFRETFITHLTQTKPPLTDKEIPLLPFTKQDIATWVQQSHLFQIKPDNATKAITTLSRVQSREDIQAKLSQVVYRLNETGDLLESDLMNDPDIEHLVVLAHQNGHISEHQMGTFFFQKSALANAKQENISIKKVPLFLGDQINPEAQCLMRAMLIKENSNVTDEQLEHWFEHMKTEPPSERFFFTRIGTDENIMHAIQNNTGHYLFIGLPIDQNHDLRMFPSVTMVNAFFDVEGRNATPVICFAARRDLSDNGRTGTRDVVVRNPYQPTPITADGYPAKGAAYTSHDLCYHARVANRVPREHQALFVDIGNFLYNSNLEGFSDAEKEHLLFLFNDMECIEYKKLRPPVSLETQAEIFWSHIEQILKEDPKNDKLLPEIKKFCNQQPPTALQNLNKADHN